MDITFYFYFFLNNVSVRIFERMSFTSTAVVDSHKLSRRESSNIKKRQLTSMMEGPILKYIF